IVTFLTLHHFTNPGWLADLGGWANSKTVFYFTRFAKKVFDYCAQLVDFWISFNEPQIYASQAFWAGRWPPQEKSISKTARVIFNIISAHKKVYKVLHQENNRAKVGITLNLSCFEPLNKNSFLDRLTAAWQDFFRNHLFLRQIKNRLDFIGLNYYFRNLVQFPCKIVHKNKVVSDLGWEIYPRGIYKVLKKLKSYNLPIYITENGLADSKDKLRANFIRDHLFWLWQALQEGVDVRGYFHWSLLDNFEWDKGLSPRFGLVEVDYGDFKRTIRKSALFYAKVAKENKLVLL
ncbi:MAG: glycoside hydrolase family 1 protein, partial [Candidatus Paceibacteria bacterium]